LSTFSDYDERVLAVYDAYFGRDFNREFTILPGYLLSIPYVPKRGQLSALYVGVFAQAGVILIL
jgi:hypothetical protein